MFVFIQNTPFYKIQVKQVIFYVRFPDYSSSLNINCQFFLSRSVLCRYRDYVIYQSCQFDKNQQRNTSKQIRLVKTQRTVSVVAIVKPFIQFCDPESSLELTLSTFASCLFYLCLLECEFLLRLSCLSCSYL